MPIINLKLQGKQATGDGTKIVCMNSDYTVRLETSDCDFFLSLPTKKLVVKYGKEYKESAITEVDEGGKTYLQAILPPIERQSSVELGVYGKESDDPKVEPKFTSQSATFECVTSVLCGLVVARLDPVLSTLTANENGKYLAADKGADGFYEVDVQVQLPTAEERTVPLDMSQGNQVVVPTASGRVMSQVTIAYPANLIPENIKKGVDIGGIVGAFETKLKAKEISVTKPGITEYIPEDDFCNGYSSIKVTVNIVTYNGTINVAEATSAELNEA